MPQSKTIRFDYTLLERLVDGENKTQKFRLYVGKKENADMRKMARHLGVSKSKYLRILHHCAINAYMTGQFEGFVDTAKDLAAMRQFKKTLYQREWAELKNDKKNQKEKDSEKEN